MRNSPKAALEYREYLTSNDYCPVSKCIDCLNLATCDKDKNDYDPEQIKRLYCKCGMFLLLMVDGRGYCLNCDKPVVIEK